MLGGRSMGGRMCSMAVAEGLPDHTAWCWISYPLHPPGRPDRLRVEHLPAIDVPCLFVSGAPITFGAPVRLKAATAAIAGDVTHVWIDGAGHGLNRADTQVARVEGLVGDALLTTRSSGFRSSKPRRAVSGTPTRISTASTSGPAARIVMAGPSPAEVVGQVPGGDEPVARSLRPGTA